MDINSTSDLTGCHITQEKSISSHHDDCGAFYPNLGTLLTTFFSQSQTLPFPKPNSHIRILSLIIFSKHAGPRSSNSTHHCLPASADTRARPFRGTLITYLYLE